MKTCYNNEIDDRYVALYLDGLVNRFYKILPIKENEAETADAYIDGLIREMLGFQALMVPLHDDDRYVMLLAILRSMLQKDNDLSSIRSDVFKSINMIKKIKEKHCSKEIDRA